MHEFCYLVALLFLSALVAHAEQILVKQVSVGSVTTCVVLENDQVKCFGRGSYGRLGYGDTQNRGHIPSTLGDNLPFVDLNFTSVASVSVGTDHACALSSAGEVKCWGYGYNGELGLEIGSAMKGDGLGEMGSNLSPVKLGTGRTATAISCGNGHTCALLDDNSVKCWGHGSDGRLGQGSFYSIGSDPNSMGDNLPSINLGTGKTAKQVSAGGMHTCIILNDNSLKCFGNGQYGKLGSESSVNLGDQPSEMGDALLPIDLGTGRTAKHVSAGGAHTCVILDNDSIACFGLNDKGQLGIGSTTHKGANAGDMGNNLAVVNLGENRTALWIECGEKVSCALLDNRSIKCWGQAAHGQLMKGSSTANLGDASNEMVSLTALHFGTRSSQILSFSVGVGGLYGHACAIYSASFATPGSLFCWGNGAFGQRGTGDTVIYGDSSGETGTQYDPSDVDLGTLIRTSSPSPANPDPPLYLLRTLQVAAGGDVTCILLETEQIKCFGNGAHGQLGNGNTENLGDSSSEIGGNLPITDLNFTSIRFISVGWKHACAASFEGELKCWGDGSHGELGLGMGPVVLGDHPYEMGANLPLIQFEDGEVVSSVSAGNQFTCTLFQEGYVKCFGNGLNGRLGQGSTQSVGLDINTIGRNLKPVELGTGLWARQVSAGGSHVCVILSDESVKCWGAGYCGQLGSKSTADLGDELGEMGDSLTRVDLGTNRTAISIATGSNHTCVLLDDYSIKCFGCNEQGQLGLDSTQASYGAGTFDMGDNLSTVDLGTNRTARRIAAGETVTCAVLDDNSVKCWGKNVVEMEQSQYLAIPSWNQTITNVAVGSHHMCVHYTDSSGFSSNVSCWGSGYAGQLGSGSTLSINLTELIQEESLLFPIDVGPLESPEMSLFTETQLHNNDSHYCRLLNSSSWNFCREVKVNLTAISLGQVFKVQFRNGGIPDALVVVEPPSKNNTDFLPSNDTSAYWTTVLEEYNASMATNGNSSQNETSLLGIKTFSIRRKGSVEKDFEPLVVSYGNGAWFRMDLYGGVWRLQPCNGSITLNDSCSLCHTWTFASYARLANQSFGHPQDNTTEYEYESFSSNSLTTELTTSLDDYDEDDDYNGEHDNNNGPAPHCNKGTLSYSKMTCCPKSCNVCKDGSFCSGDCCNTLSRSCLHFPAPCDLSVTLNVVLFYSTTVQIITKIPALVSRIEGQINDAFTESRIPIRARVLATLQTPFEEKSVSSFTQGLNGILDATRDYSRLRNSRLKIFYLFAYVHEYPQFRWGMSFLDCEKGMEQGKVPCFAIIEVSEGLDIFVATHELGHLLGADHEVGQAFSKDPNSINHAFMSIRNSRHSFVTVMHTDPSHLPQRVQTVNRFSDPLSYFEGESDG